MPSHINLPPLTLNNYMQIVLKQRERAINNAKETYGHEHAVVQALQAEIGVLHQAIAGIKDAK